MSTSHDAPLYSAPDVMPELLRLTGARPGMSRERTERVRAAVHVEWQRYVRRRVRGRRIVVGSALVTAAAALIVLATRTDLGERGSIRAGDVVAAVERSEGSAVARGASVRVGEWIRTDDRSRVALRFGDRRSVRLDAHSRVRALSPAAIELVSGAVYVDSGGDSGGFEVRTPLATARDIGTQFEVRLMDRGVRIRVRTGLVELRGRSQRLSAADATEVILTGGRALRRAVAPHGPEWEWAARLAPPVDIERMSLDAFLKHVAREHGWALRYADPSLAHEAAAILLHGSVTGLSANDAVEVVVTTSGLRYRLRDGNLVVFRQVAAR